MVINHPYTCEITITNISPKQKDVTLLFQIPNGSMPLGTTKFIESKKFLLQPYTTQKTNQHFYFPADGKFEHFQSNISEGDFVTAKSAKKLLQVGKKRVIKNVVTFKDMMLTTETDALRMEKILDLYTNKYFMILDQKFSYDTALEKYFAYQDVDFYGKLVEIFDAKMLEKPEVMILAARHYTTILQDEEYKSQIPRLLQSLKQLQVRGLEDDDATPLRRFIFRTLDTDLVKISSEQLFYN